MHNLLTKSQMYVPPACQGLLTPQKMSLSILPPNMTTVVARLTKLESELTEKDTVLQKLEDKVSVLEKTLHSTSAQLANRVDQLQATTAVLNDTLSATEEAIQSVTAAIHLKAIVDAYLGTLGWRGKNRRDFIKNLPEKGEVFTLETMLHLGAKFATETNENTTHACTIRAAQKSMEWKLLNNQITQDEYVVLESVLILLQLDGDANVADITKGPREHPKHPSSIQQAHHRSSARKCGPSREGQLWTPSLDSR